MKRLRELVDRMLGRPVLPPDPMRESIIREEADLVDRIARLSGRTPAQVRAAAAIRANAIREIKRTQRLAREGRR